MVNKLFGLTADQFCQVAILPQGRFRQFLLAPAEHRRQILSNMFNSSRHAKLQAALQKEQFRVKTLLEKAWQEREELISRYQTSGGDPRDSYQRSQEELKVVEQTCKQHQHRSSEWERSLEEAVRYEVLERQKDVSERELRVLTHEEEAAADQLVTRLRKVLPHFERWRELQAQADEIGNELREQRAQYDKLKSGTNFLEEEVEKARRLEEERFSIHRTLERLDLLMEETRGVEVLSLELERTGERLQDLAQMRSELAAIVKADKQRVFEIEEELQKIQGAEAKLQLLKEELAKLSERRGRIRQSELLKETYLQAGTRVERFERLVEDLTKERKALQESLREERQQDLHDSLLVLKAQLREGFECPLCGSTDHPAPYQTNSGQQRLASESEESLEHISRRLELAEGELLQARDRKARLEGRLEERSEEDFDEADLDESTLESLKRTVSAVEAKVSHKDGLLQELRGIQEASKPDRVKLKKMRLLKERLDSTLESIAVQQETRRQGLFKTVNHLFPQLGEAELDRLGEAIELEKGRLQQRLQELSDVKFSTERAELMAETFALQLAETRASEKRRETLLKQAQEVKKNLEDAFRLDFTGWDDLSFSLGRVARENSLQNQSALVDRETLIRTVERQLHQSQELLATIPVPEMKSEQIRHALSREREHLEIKVGRRSALEKSVEQASEDVKKYDTLVEKIRIQETRMSHVDRMNRLSSGSQGLNFHDWYLERVFRRVISAANLRLEILAPNRFCLGLQDGLDVKVVDFLAGKERSATTLSGGESFLASLALALGLGDVLQADRVSRERLQTLFIDEGFGYLDRRAMEAALDCLESLKQEGRTVGIISHVPALRERVRAQVVVAPNDSPLPYGVDRIQVFAE